VYSRSCGNKADCSRDVGETPSRGSGLYPVLGGPRQSLKRIAQLEQRVNELEARLNRHSGNSSQPPSQDPPRAPRNRKEKSGRKPGGQKGHQGNRRELAPPEKVNRIVEHRAEECPHCRKALQYTAARPAPFMERRQVWELPEIQPVITEHRLQAGWCAHCQTWVKPDLPAEVGRSACGPRLQAWVAILTGHFRQSRRQVVELLQELCGLPGEPSPLGLTGCTRGNLKFPS
jgi:transposase